MERDDTVVAVIAAGEENADERPVVGRWSSGSRVFYTLRHRAHETEVAHLCGERRHAESTAGLYQELASGLFHTYL
jgi:hypothetical protein